MAKKGGNPQNLRPPFKKGESGNPSGRPKDLFTASRLKGMIDRFMLMTRTELQEIIENKSTSMIELQLAAALEASVKTGDFSKIAQIIDRAIGKVQDKLEVSTPTPFILRKRDGEEIEMGIKPKDEES